MLNNPNFRKSLLPSIVLGGVAIALLIGIGIGTGITGLAIGTSQSIEFGDTKSGEINPAGERDPWTFDGAEGQIIVISHQAVSESQLDPLLSLQAPSGIIAASNDDSGGTYDSQIYLTLLESGTYTILAQGYGGTSTGEYELTLAEGIALEDDEGGPIEIGGTKSAGLNPSGDVDEWTFDGTEGQNVTIDHRKADGSPLDPYLSLRAPSGVIEDSNDDSGGNYNSKIERKLNETGSYTILAQGYGGYSTGNYTLSLSAGVDYGPDEGGPIGIGDTKSGNLVPAADIDEWTFDGSAGQVVVIDLRASSGSALDPFLNLIAPSGVIEDSNDDSLGTYNSHIDRTLSETGTYTISAEGYGGYSTGGYELNLTQGMEHATDQSGSINFQETKISELYPNNDTDEWTFDGTQGQKIFITLQSVTEGGLDTWIDLQAPSGGIEAFNDDHAGTRNSYLEWSLSETGTYTIIARGYAGASGEYELTLSSEAVLASEPSAPITPQITVPGNPSEFVVNEDVSTGELLLQWNPPEEDGGDSITGYEVTSSFGQSWLAPANVSGDTTVSRRINTEFLQPGQTYIFNVSAVNSAGVGPSSEASFTIPPTIPPAPENLTISNGSVAGEIILSWDAPTSDGGSSLTGYSVWSAPSGTRLDSADANQWQVSIPDNGTPSLAIKNFPQGQNHTLTVGAKNIVGVGPLSQIPFNVPSAPENVSVELNTTDWDGVVTVKWDRPLDDDGNLIPLEGIDLYYSADSKCLLLSCFSLKIASPQEQATRILLTSSSQSFYSLDHGPGHRFIVVAYNAVGRSQSPISEPLTIVRKPTNPSEIKVFPANKSAVVSWKSSESRGGGPIAYKISVNHSGPSDAWAGVEVMAGDPNKEYESFTVRQLTNGIPYNFTVAAVDTTGENLSPVTVSTVPIAAFSTSNKGKLENVSEGALTTDQQDIWTFEGTLGSKITLEMAVTRGDIKPLIVLSSPSGMNTAWESSDANTSVSINDHWLTETGTYSVRTASLTSASGSYRLSINSADPSQKIVQARNSWAGRAWGIAGTGNACEIVTGNRGEGVEIAILDSGIDYNHPDLMYQLNHSDRDKVVRRINFVGVDSGNSPSTYALDPAIKGHGTELAGVAAGTRGIAPGACLWAVKTVWDFAGGGFDEWRMAGFDYAVKGPDGTPRTGDEPDVIAHATGSPNTSDGLTAMSVMMDIATEQGIVVVQSAGNQPESMYTLNESASSVKAITVGALTSDLKEVQGRSSRGPTADLRIKPDLVAPGQNINTTKASTEHDLSNPSYQAYVVTSGTSIAVPHVAGVAALIKQQHPDWTPEMIKAAMMNTADPLTNDRLWEQGAGAINKDRALTTSLLVMPPSLSFGQLTTNKTGKHTIILQNFGANPIEVNLSTETRIYSGGNWPQDNNTGNGLYLADSSDVAVSSSTETVSPGAVTSVDLSAGPFTADSPEGWYEGRVSVTSSEGTLTVPYIFYLSHSNSNYDKIFGGPKMVCGNTGFMARFIGASDCNSGPSKPNQYPVKPDSKDQVYITAVIGDARDSVPSGIPGVNHFSVELVYSLSSVESKSAVVNMLDDGLQGDRYANDRLYGAAIGPFNSKESVTYYIRATNGEGNVFESETVTFDVNDPFIKTSDILVLNSPDGGMRHQGRYLQNVVDSLGLPYDLWDEMTRGPVTLSTLNSYLTGAVIAVGVNPDSGANIRDFLDNGGNLLLSTSQDWRPIQFGSDGINFAVKYLNTEQWNLEQYFPDGGGGGTGATSRREFGGVAPSLQGVSNDPIGNGLELQFGIRSTHATSGGRARYCGEPYADPVIEHSTQSCMPAMQVLRTVEYGNRNDVEDIFHFGAIDPLSSPMDTASGPRSLVDRIVKIKDGEGTVDFEWGNANSRSFFDPIAIVVDRSGNIFVADDTDRIYKYGPDRQLIKTIGGSRHQSSASNSDFGKFYSISGLAIDAQGNLYVADIDDFRGSVSILDNDGNYLGKVGGDFQWGASRYSGYDRQLMNTQITTPVDVGIDKNGDVWVVELGATFYHGGNGTNRVMKFQPGAGGSHISTPVSRLGVQANDIPCQTRDKWTGGKNSTHIAIHNNESSNEPEPLLLTGSYPYQGAKYGSLQLISSSGSLKGCNDPNLNESQWGNSPLANMENPRAIAINSSGQVIVGQDTGDYHSVNGRRVYDDTSVVVIYDIHTGEKIRSLFKGGVENNLFGPIADIFIASDDSIYILDTGDSSLDTGDSSPVVEKFSANGEFLWTLGNTASGEEPDFNGIRGISHDNFENIYAADSFNHRIVKLDKSGNTVATFGSKGHNVGEFYFPEGVAVSDDGTIFIADTGNHRIQKIDASGKYTAWGSKGESESEFKFPKGIALDSSGNVYVADTENHRIQKFTSEGVFISKWGGPRPFAEQRGRLYSRGPDYTYENTRYMGHDGQIKNPKTHEEVKISRTTGEKIFTNVNGYLWYPGALAVDSSGNIYVADTRHGMVQKFNAEGQLIDPAAEYRMGAGNGKLSYVYSHKLTESDKADGVAVAVNNEGNIYTSGIRNILSSDQPHSDTSYLSVFAPGDLSGQYDDLPVWSTLKSQHATGVVGPITGLTITDSGDIYAAVSSFVDYPVGRPAAYRLDNGVYKVVYLGFDVNAIVEPSQRDELISRALKWLSGIEAAPTVISPPANADVSDQEITFKWHPSENAEDYRLQIMNLTDPEIFGIRDIYLDGTQYSETITQPGKYFWRVRPRDVDCKPGSWSKPRTISVSSSITGSAPSPTVNDIRCSASTPISTPVVTPQAATSTPVVTPQAATSTPVVTPQAATSTPVVTPQAATSTPVVTPQAATSTPVVTVDTFREAYTFVTMPLHGQRATFWDPQIGVRITTSESIKLRNDQGDYSTTIYKIDDVDWSIPDLGDALSLTLCSDETCTDGQPVEGATRTLYGGIDSLEEGRSMLLDFYTATPLFGGKYYKLSISENALIRIGENDEYQLVKFVDNPDVVFSTADMTRFVLPINLKYDNSICNGGNSGWASENSGQPMCLNTDQVGSLVFGNEEEQLSHYFNAMSADKSFTLSPVKDREGFVRKAIQIDRGKDYEPYGSCQRYAEVEGRLLYDDCPNELTLPSVQTQTTEMFDLDRYALIRDEDGNPNLLLNYNDKASESLYWLNRQRGEPNRYHNHNVTVIYNYGTYQRATLGAATRPSRNTDTDFTISNEESLRTWTHELGHALFGLPDLYYHGAIGESPYQVGNIDIMGSNNGKWTPITAWGLIASELAEPLSVITDSEMTDFVYTDDYQLLSSEWTPTAAPAIPAEAAVADETFSIPAAYVSKVQEGINGVSGLAGIFSMAVTSDGNYIYAASQYQSSLIVFSIDPDSGSLTLIQKIRDTNTNPSTVSLSPDEKHLYVTSSRADKLIVFSRDATTGTLTSLPEVTETPVVATSEETWSTMAAGYDHTFGLKTDGTLWAWGNNDRGQFGDGTTVASTIPTLVGSETNLSKIAVGRRYAVALKTDGTLWNWSEMFPGSIEGEVAWNNSLSPTQIGSATSTWSDIAMGEYHALGIKTDGTLWAWGRNRFGQLGDGTTENKTIPTQIGSETNWSDIAAGGRRSVGIKTDGTLWNWGLTPTSPILGDLTPIQIGSATNWSDIASGKYHSVGLKTDGTLWAWGDIGDGTTENRIIPTQIGSATWSSIATGNFHTVGIKTDGTLWTWGYNGYGQLGDGTTENKTIPTQIGSATNWSKIAAGALYTIALKTDSTLWAWGINHSGQIGDGTISWTNERSSRAVSTPVAIGGDGGKFLFTDVTGNSGTGGGAYGLDVSPDGNHVYVTGNNPGTGEMSNIVVFNRNPSSGALTLVEKIQAENYGIDEARFVEVSPDGNHVYVLSRGDENLSVFSRDASSGALTFVTKYAPYDYTPRIDGLRDSSSLEISPDGKNVYTTGRSPSALSVFSRDLSTGLLTLVEELVYNNDLSSTIGLKFASSVDVSPDGSYVYATGSRSWALSVFSRDSSSGSLTFVKMFADTTVREANSHVPDWSICDQTSSHVCNGIYGLKSADLVVVNPVNNDVYVAASGNYTIVTFDPLNSEVTGTEVSRLGRPAIAEEPASTAYIGCGSSNDKCTIYDNTQPEFKILKIPAIIERDTKEVVGHYLIEFYGTTGYNKNISLESETVNFSNKPGAFPGGIGIWKQDLSDQAWITYKCRSMFSNSPNCNGREFFFNNGNKDTYAEFYPALPRVNSGSGKSTDISSFHLFPWWSSHALPLDGEELEQELSNMPYSIELPVLEIPPYGSGEGETINYGGGSKVAIVTLSFETMVDELKSRLRTANDAQLLEVEQYELNGSTEFTLQIRKLENKVPMTYRDHIRPEQMWSLKGPLADEVLKYGYHYPHR